MGSLAVGSLVNKVVVVALVVGLVRIQGISAAARASEYMYMYMYSTLVSPPYGTSVGESLGRFR